MRKASANESLMTHRKIYDGTKTKGYSDNVHFWHEPKLLLRPLFPWELVQIGNCGSPIETKAGWLVLSHGVGPEREYCIAAFLLDLDNPK
jgi:predicted GH43/DUF377 family glycosyl hydrolase